MLGQAVDDGSGCVDGEVALDVTPVEGGHGVQGAFLVPLRVHGPSLAPSPEARQAHRRCDVADVQRVPADPALVPDRLVGLVDPAVGAEDEEAVEAAGEPAVVGDREDGALEGVEAVLERLGRLQVEVVGRLVEQQQGGARTARAAGSGTAPAGRPTATRRSAPRPAPARSGRARGRPARAASRSRWSSPRCRISSSVRPMQRRVLVGLREPAGPHPRAEPHPAGVLDRRRPDVADRLVLDVGVAAAGARAAAGSATCPSRWSRARRPARRTRPRGRRASSARSSSQLASQTTARLAGAAAGEPHRHLLAQRHRLGRPGLLELAQPGLRRPGSARPCRRCTPPSAWYIMHQRLELGVLLVPAPAQLLEPGVPVGRGPAWYVANPPGCTHTVLPAAARLEGHDPGGDPVEQLAVVADEQHRLGRLDEPRPRASAWPARRGSCPARRAAAPRRARAAAPRARAASARRRTASTPAPLRPLERRCRAPRRCRRPRASPARSRRRRPSRPAPARSRSGRARSSRSIIASSVRSTSSGRRGAPRSGATETSRSRTVVSSRTLPMNWRITPRPPLRVTAPVGCREVAGDDPQQRGLAGAVGADQRDLGALPDPEGDVAQQAPAVGQGEADGVDVEVAHEAPVSPTRAANSPEIRGPGARRQCSVGLQQHEEEAEHPGDEGRREALARRQAARLGRSPSPPRRAGSCCRPAPRAPRCAPRHRARS